MRCSLKICDFCGGDIHPSSDPTNPEIKYRLNTYRITVESATAFGFAVTYDICADCQKKMIQAVLGRKKEKTND